MNRKAQNHLERPVSRELAARKVAALRGHEGREGGWIYASSAPNARPLCQGWKAYADRVEAGGRIGRDDETGRWHVSVPWLDQHEIAAAERLFG